VKTFFLVLSVVVLAGCGAPPVKGHESGGGDVCEIVYRKILEEVQSSGFLAPLGKNALKHSHITRLAKLQIKCGDQPLELDGSLKTAITYIDENKTEVNFNRWKASPEDVKKALVVHETFVLLGMEKTGDYHLSIQVMPNILKLVGARLDLGEKLVFKNEGLIVFWRISPTLQHYTINADPPVPASYKDKRLRWNFFDGGTQTYLLNWSPTFTTELTGKFSVSLLHPTLVPRIVNGHTDLANPIYVVLAGDDNKPLFYIDLLESYISGKQLFEDTYPPATP
jgi:hypothetical protein